MSDPEPNVQLDHDECDYCGAQEVPVYIFRFKNKCNGFQTQHVVCVRCRRILRGKAALSRGVLNEWGAKAFERVILPRILAGRRWNVAMIANPADSAIVPASP